MAYEKQNFTDGQTLEAEHLNKIEDGIVNTEKALENYQPKGDYPTSKEVDDKIANAQLGGSDVDLSDYVTKEVADETYQPKGDYLTEHQKIKTINGQSMIGEGDVKIEDLDSTKGQYTVIPHEKYALAICDSEGNVAVAIKNDGTVKAANLETNNGGSDTSCWLKGKHCYVLGDSLSADTKSTGSWHQKFCELTGAILDADKNRGWFSIGGTATIGTHTEQNACCQMRAKRLVDHYKEGNPVDVIFIQNVNDINNNRFSAGINGKGANTDKPFFENQVIIYNDYVIPVTTASTDVIAYFKENFATITADITPMTGTVIEMLYTTGGTAKELKITSAPTTDGNITLTLKKASNYRDEKFNIAVKAGMSINDVVKAILEWNYVDIGTYDDVEGANDDSVIFSSPYSLTFDGGTTGVTATVTDTSAVNRYPIAFKSLNVDDFSNVDSWGYESSVSYWSAQKGLIEYLQKNIPNAKIFYLILPYYKVTYPATAGSTYLREDGSFNMEYWVEQGRGSKTAGVLYAEQPLVANYYGCSYIDVVNNCSISPVNIEEYYPSNDVHPKTAGYNVWGETIARLLAGK